MVTSTISSQNRSYFASIFTIGILFFIFGFVTWLNGTLIPFLKISCELNNVEAYFVTTAFYISYFIMGPPASYILKKTGFKNGMALGLLVMAVGSLVFIPAALTRTFELFLTGLFIQGTGLTILQTASNPYITILGPRESAAKRIAIMGIANKVAGTVSPIILGAIILSGANELMEQVKLVSGTEKEAMLDALAGRVIMPYIVMAVILSLLAFMIRYAHLPEIDREEENNPEFNAATAKNAWYKYPHLILGFLSIFFYVGVEVMAGDTIALYGKSLGISLDKARYFTSYTLASMVIGYIIGIITIPKYIRQDKALAVSAVLGVLFTIGALMTSGIVSVYFIAFLGLANAMMWPCIWPLALSDLGRFTKTGSALLVMGILGGALIPVLYGVIVEYAGHREAYMIMIPFYAFILYFAVKGHKLR